MYHFKEREPNAEKMSMMSNGKVRTKIRMLDAAIRIRVRMRVPGVWCLDLRYYAMSLPALLASADWCNIM